MMLTTEVSFTRNTRFAVIPGMLIATACGSTTLRIACQGVSPRLRDDCSWIGSTESSPLRRVSAMKLPPRNASPMMAQSSWSSLTPSFGNP